MHIVINMEGISKPPGQQSTLLHTVAFHNFPSSLPLVNTKTVSEMHIYNLVSCQRCFDCLVFKCPKLRNHILWAYLLIAMLSVTRWRCCPVSPRDLCKTQKQGSSSSLLANHPGPHFSAQRTTSR